MKEVKKTWSQCVSTDMMASRLRPDLLLVDLRDFFFRLMVGGTKNLTGHFQSFFFFFFLELFFFFFLELFFIIIIFNISRKNPGKTSEVNVNLYIFHHFPKNQWTGQSLLTVSLSKMHRQNLKIIFFSTKQIIFRVGG